MTGHSFTNSERKTFAQCRTRWLLAYGLGIKQERETGPIRVGNLWHDAMERLWGGEAPESIGGWLLSLATVPAKLRPSFDYEAASDASTALDMFKRYVAQWAWHGPRWELIQNESVMQADLPRGGFTGKVDKIVRVDGLLWVVEHKTTSLSLDEWVERHEYDLQGIGYAWLARKQLGLDVVGIIYDLALRKNPSEPRLNKDGSISKTTGLPSCTAEAFEAAMRRAKLKGWEEETLATLRARDARGYWFREVAVRFEQEEFDRFERESWSLASELDVLHNCSLLHQGRKSLSATRERLPSLSRAKQAEVVVDVLRDELATTLPRNTAACFDYNRPCPYASLCRYRQTEGYEGLTATGVTHAELQEEKG